jgi:hypothetical protein
MRTLRIITRLCLSFSALASAQAPLTGWHSIEPELSEQLKLEILRVIDQAGIAVPQNIYTRTVANDCTQVKIESSREANRVHYDLLFMKRRHGQCPAAAMSMTLPERTDVPEDTLVLNGAATEERWRISDEKGWYLDVALGEGVPLESATAIIRSIRQGSYTYEAKLGQSGRSVVLTAPLRIELNHTTRFSVYHDPADQSVYGLELDETRTSGTYSTFVVRGSSVRALSSTPWVH